MRFVRKSIAVSAALVAAATAVIAQQSQPSDPSKLVESIEVRVINVDVVVTDRRGNPITGLTKDDFEIFENGVPKPISNFYEVNNLPAKTATAGATAQPVPAPAPRRAADVPEEQKRRIIFYVDNLSLAPFNRNRVFKQMKQFVTEVMRPGDEAMVATFNRSMKVRVPFTRDATHIQQTFDIIAGESALGVSNRSERKSAEDRIRESRSYDEALATARAYAQSVDHDLRQSVSSINALMSTLAGLEGKKVLVLTSEGFPMSPGREIFTFLDETAREKQWQSGSAMLEGLGFQAHNLIESVARTANANNITLYALHAAGLSAGSENSAENARATSFVVTQAAVTNTTESMQMMADLTGGVASVQSNNFGDTFQRIRTDLDAYYSLGYRAGTERVDRQRNLSVRVKKKGLYVRNRQTFVEKSTYAEMNDRVIANLLYRTKTNDLGILVRAGTPRPADDDLFRVPVEVQIPMDRLTLLPQGDDIYSGGFDVYVVVANKDNDMSDVARRTHQLRVPTADMAKVKGKFYTYELELLMEKGLNKISIGVVDLVSNENGFAREQIITRDLR